MYILYKIMVTDKVGILQKSDPTFPISLSTRYVSYTTPLSSLLKHMLYLVTSILSTDKTRSCGGST